MKKYITVAALLAAGTAFANASINATVHLSFDGEATGAGVSLTNSISSSSASITRNSTGYMNFSVTDDYLSNSGKSFDARYNCEYGIKISNALSWTSDFTLSVAVKAGTNEGNWLNLVQIGDSSNHLRIQSSNGTAVGLYGNGTLSADATALNVKNSNTNSLSSEVFTLLTLVYTTDGTNSFLKFYTNGELQASSQAAWSVNSNLANDIYLGKGVSGTPWGGYFDEVAVYDGALTSDQIKTHLVEKSAPSSIPEPSAFGLLAGIGALALVASRRRRK